MKSTLYFTPSSLHVRENLAYLFNFNSIALKTEDLHCMCEEDLHAYM